MGNESTDIELPDSGCASEWDLATAHYGQVDTTSYWIVGFGIVGTSEIFE